MMERKIARDFQTAVRTLLEDDDPEMIYATLKAYHQVIASSRKNNVRLELKLEMIIF